MFTLYSAKTPRKNHSVISYTCGGYFSVALTNDVGVFYIYNNHDIGDN